VILQKKLFETIHGRYFQKLRIPFVESANMDPSKKWEEIERERRFGYQPPPDPTFLPTQNVVRVRKEYNARDQVNSRHWDFFHATPPTLTSSEEVQQRSQNPIYMDMNPIPSRTNTVQYRIQPSYIPDPPRGATTSADLGVPPLPNPITPPAAFGQNPYTQRMDANGSEARNMIRELRGSVVENNGENQMDAARLLTERQFSDRWLPPKAALDINSLQAYELLRPKQDEWRNG
jgi:hypothetical protein